MKIITTLLSAALIAGASTVAIAQSGGTSGSGAADSTLSPYDKGRGNDDNPTGMTPTRWQEIVPTPCSPRAARG